MNLFINSASPETTIRLPNGKIVELRKPQEGLIRSRKVVTRSRSRSTGKYPSWKMARMIQWESPHELNAYRLLDCDPAVLAFQEQPYEIHYTLNGENHRHYPDVLVQRRSGKELWEVKTQADALREDVSERTALMAAELPSMGFGYRLMQAEDLGAQPTLFNALLILHHGRFDISIQERQLVLQFLKERSEIRWGDVLAGQLGSKGRRSVCRMLLEGTLMLDISKPIGSETCIRPVVGNVNVPSALTVLGA